MGFPTFVCAATAINHLNDDALILRDVEQSRDNNVTAAWMVVGVALVSMLIEGVITAMRFCRRNRVVIATVVSINFYSCECSEPHFQSFPISVLQFTFIVHGRRRAIKFIIYVLE